MGQTTMDLRRRDPEPAVASHPADEMSLEDSLELAYGARMRAVLHGAASAQARTALAVAHLERLCLESRELHRLSGSVNSEPSYYLG